MGLFDDMLEEAPAKAPGLFDDMLGAAQRLSGSRGMTARLTVRYRALTPIETELVLRAVGGERRGRRVTCTATCHAGDLLTPEAEALFIRVDFTEVQTRMAARRDPADDAADRSGA